MESSLTRVTAEVVVRIDDFHAYIKKLAEGDVAVDEGIFVKMKTEQKQQTNQADLLYDNVISPILSGEVVEFTVGEPKTFQDDECKNSGKSRDGGLLNFSNKYGNTNIICFQINASLNKEFIKNMRNTIESIAATKKTVNISDEVLDHFSELYFYRVPQDQFDKLSDISLLLDDGKDRTPKTLQEYNELFLVHDPHHEVSRELYFFRNVLQQWAKKIQEVKNIRVPKLEISLIGPSGETVQKEKIEPDDNGDRAFGQLYIAKGDNWIGKKPHSLIRSMQDVNNPNANIQIVENKSFLAFIAINPDALAKTKKINVKLVN